MFCEIIYLSKTYSLVFICHSFYLQQLVLGVSQLVKMFWFLTLCFDLYMSALSLFASSAFTLVFQHITRKLWVQISGLRMRNFTWNWFHNKNLLIDSLFTPLWRVLTWMSNTLVNLFNHNSTSVCPSFYPDKYPHAVEKTFLWMHGRITHFQSHVRGCTNFYGKPHVAGPDYGRFYGISRDAFTKKYKHSTHDRFVFKWKINCLWLNSFETILSSRKEKQILENESSTSLKHISPATEMGMAL